jgi:hypothetical protein
MTPQEKLDYIKGKLIELKAFSECHHGDQPSHVIMHGLTVDIPERIGELVLLIDPMANVGRRSKEKSSDVPF